MKLELIDLLREREVVHPTRIAGVETGHRGLRVTIAGYPWWREGTHGEEEQIVLSFEGICEGVLEPETLLNMEEDEALEVLRVSPLSEERWAEGSSTFETYCSEPLPEPFKVYAAVEDYLWNEGAPRTARDYLNLPDGSLVRFCAMAASASFLLARAPQRIHEIVMAELRRQKVGHKVLQNEWPLSCHLFIQIGGSSFVCERATAEM